MGNRKPHDGFIPSPGYFDISKKIEQIWETKPEANQFRFEIDPSCLGRTEILIDIIDKEDHKVAKCKIKCNDKTIGKSKVRVPKEDYEAVASYIEDAVDLAVIDNEARYTTDNCMYRVLRDNFGRIFMTVYPFMSDRHPDTVVKSIEKTESIKNIVHTAETVTVLSSINISNIVQRILEESKTGAASIVFGDITINFFSNTNKYSNGEVNTLKCDISKTTDGEVLGGSDIEYASKVDITSGDVSNIYSLLLEETMERISNKYNLGLIDSCVVYTESFGYIYNKLYKREKY